MFKNCLRIITLVTLLATPAFGQEAAPVDATATPSASVAAQRQEILEWLESYVGNEILLTPEGLDSLIEKVESLSDEDFAKWMRETRRLRTILQSPEWQDTRRWMRDFLAVQAIYSEEELAEFRLDVQRMTPAEMIDVIERIRRKHESLIWTRQASERNRQASLGLRNNLVQQQRSASPTGAAGAGRFGSSTQATAPRRSSFTERRNSYRPNIGWPGVGWGRW